jgi:hypothetical protein
MKNVKSGVLVVLLAFVIVVGACARGGGPDVVAAPAAAVPTAAPAQAVAPVSASSVRGVLDQYCVRCHNEATVLAQGEPQTFRESQLRAVGIAFDAIDVTRPGATAETWERVITKLRAGSMPPFGSRRPDDDGTLQAVAGWLEAEIDGEALRNPNPGRTSSVHRLNRTEYRNVIRDLFALDIDVTQLLPGDETSDTGFDNYAEVLSVSTSQLEAYLSAARKITRLATGLPPAPSFARFENSTLLTQSARQNEAMPLGSRGGISGHYDFPASGEYLFRIQMGSNWQDYIRGLGRRQQLDLRIDGALVRRFDVGGEAPPGAGPKTFSPADFGTPEWEKYLQTADEGMEVLARVEAGPHVVSASFVRKMWEPEGVLQPVLTGELLSNDEMLHGDTRVHALTLEGPYEGAVAGDTPSRRQIFVCYPSAASEEQACAMRIVSRLARLAYRRPATDQEVQTLLEFFDDGREEGGSFDAGIQLALERLLVDPAFLLRVLEDPADAGPGQVYELSDLDLASRLSFFMWSSIPDEALLDAAELGELSDPAVLRQQVRRMLADPRASALVTNFASQWLHLRSVSDVSAEPSVFPHYDADLVEAFRQETELFIASTIEEDRSVLDLLSADYTFLNERLARHYGIPGIYGSRFRRVTVPNTDQRGGLLAHGSFLSVTSYPDRTSPVLRGKWLLEAIFGDPPPGPPPNVPELPTTGEGGKAASVRERLALHRTDPICSSCHAQIDPAGFSLEGYDAIGGWRDMDEGGHPVDDTGNLLSGETFEGVAGLRRVLLARPERFVGTLAERLLAYGVGREPEFFDRPHARKIVRDAADDGYRWSSIIIGVVESPTFRMRRAAE